MGVANFAIIWGLNIIGISPGTIFAGVSIITMVISFSAESLIADVVTGVFLLFDNIYNVDDIIEIGGYRGTVVKIGIRTTSIKDTGGIYK
ncbi:mechanosensitive ion channel domain-containing protein [Candidatus Merdisoma sp. JLR.KK011]|uniref:mechanosensitive ion channel domain-containing protein n=1 Tax=Candidatus Merdisoma sp. JLR.KK011 TaxID=3114299 RepID=UPI002FF38300